MPEILQNLPISISRAPLKALRLEGEWGTDIKVLLHDVFQWVCLLLGSVLIYHMTIILQNLQFTFFYWPQGALGWEGGEGAGWAAHDIQILWYDVFQWISLSVSLGLILMYNMPIILQNWQICNLKASHGLLPPPLECPWHTNLCCVSMSFPIIKINFDI